MSPTEKYSFDEITQNTLEHLSVPFAVYQFVDKRVVTLVVSDGFLKLLGYEDRKQAYYDMDNDMYRDTHPDDVSRIANAALEFAVNGGKYETIYRSKIRGTSDYRIVHAYGEHVYTDDGVRLAQIWYSDEGIYRDDGDKGLELNQSLSNALHENSIIKEGRYDYLTGLPSMSHFLEMTDVAARTMRDLNNNPTLLYMDFSGLKFFNAKYGYEKGDIVLREFGKLLAEIFSNERSCRIGADHFAVLCEEEKLKDRIDDLFNKYQEIDGSKSLPLHVGVYVAQSEMVHVSVACDRAKMACNALSGKYETAVNYYSHELSEDAENRLYIAANLDRALQEKWIEVHYQPIVRSINLKVCDIEALARWRDPERGLLFPDRFIPVLEESGLIYKLDLYVLDQILEKIRIMHEKGLSVVPHSLNLSRSDFECCDIVEEIRKRTDEAHIPHEMITIEITESIISSNFEFMKKQIERFRSLGFPVWMDDFGSGYSSIYVLQTIQFDLIKFDMSFMRRLNDTENAPIVLTELMKLAASLGADTICEGVETEEQVRFLQEVGCSKLQGYYFSKPVSLNDIINRFKAGSEIVFEDQDSSSYYEQIGRINLYDLNVIGNADEDALHGTFNGIPIAVLEVNGNNVRYIRSNRSYKEFALRFLDLDIYKWEGDLSNLSDKYDPTFMVTLRQCKDNDSPIFFSENMADGSLVHSFMRKVGVNPSNGAYSVVAAILSVSEPDSGTTYADIASSLAADYYNLFIIDLDTNDYIKYSSKVGDEQMSLERHGEDFFESVRVDAMSRIYELDREHFLNIFTKENVLREIEDQGVFTTTYRIVDTGSPMYVNMKVTRMKGGNRLIIGISIIDTHMKQLEEERKLRQEKMSLGRIASLSPNYLVLYMIDPVTNHYTQYNPSNEYEELGLAKQGEDFFKDVENDSPKAVAPEDLENHIRVLSKENLLKEIQKNGYLIHNYRFLLDGRYVPASLRASMVEESDGEKIIVGITNDEDEYNRRLEEAYKKASNTAVIYNHVAHALARDYTELYYVNMESDEFIAFHTNDKSGVLSEARRGNEFFESVKNEVALYIHPDDQEAYLKTFNKEFLNEVLNNTKVYELTYRRIDKGAPMYVQTKISRMEDDERYIVIAISDVDELIRQRKAQERIEEEQIIYSRLHALIGNFIVVYVVDPETDNYREFNATDDYVESFAQAKEGTDFFNRVRRVALAYNYPGDLGRFLSAFTKENIMNVVKQNGIFNLDYRFMMDGKATYVQLKAAMVEEKEGPRLVVGLYDVDAQVRQEEELSERLHKAQSQANIDALTGVKNKHAFLAAETKLDNEIAESRNKPFAIVMMDVNDLKMVNDTEGHQAGDQYLRDACKVICHIFDHSPVFRVGGDEFAVIAQGQDYDNIDMLIERLSQHNEEAKNNSGIVIACGMAKYENGELVANVFERADQSMYVNKNDLKSGRKD